jgi:hypothetical protein
MSERKQKIIDMLHDQDLSNNDKFKIDGPWAFKGLHDLNAPVYIFVPGGEKVIIGEVVARIDKGLKFDIELNEGYEHTEVASFDVPMRFHVRIEKDKS